MKRTARVFFFCHPLASPERPGRWPFWAHFEAQTQKGESALEAFLYLDGRGPGVLNSNQDPCVCSEPLPWFLAHCRLDSTAKEHNRVLYPNGRVGGLLTAEALPGDWVVFGGVLFPESEECRACTRPCGKVYLFVDTVFCVKDKLELPVEETGKGRFEHRLGSPEGYAAFRKAAAALGIELPHKLAEFRHTPAWRYNLADTERHHRFVDYRPYQLLLAEQGQSYLPLSTIRPPARCPLLWERPGLWWTPWEETGLPAPDELFPEVQEGLRQGVVALPEEAGKKFLALIEARTALKVTRVKKIFHFRASKSTFYLTVNEVLRRLGYSQREVASWGTIQFLTLNKISRGETPPTLRTLERLARTVGTGMKDLFEEPGGEVRDLFHRIAGCVHLEAALRFEGQKGPCASVPKTLGLKGLKESPRPEPWAGDLAKARVVMVAQSPSWEGVRAELSREEYPQFSEKWFPGRVEEYFSARVLSGKALFDDQRLCQALKLLQTLVGPEEGFPAPAVTYLRHCAGGDEKVLKTCAKRFFPEILKAIQGTVVVLPEAASEAETFFRDWVEIFRGESFVLKARPKGDEDPLLDQETNPENKGWRRLIFGSRGRPQLALILQREEDLPEEMLAALRFHILDRQVAAFKLWTFFNRKEVAQILFEKIQGCPEIKRHLMGERGVPCRKLFWSYKAVHLKEIFRPLPWAGRLTKAPVLFVGFKPPLKRAAYPSYRDVSLEEARHLFEKATKGQEAPFAQIRGILAEFLGVENADSLPEELWSYTPVVQCRNAINEGSFPVPVIRVCRDRYLAWKLILSPAELVVVLGRKASLAVRELLGLGLNSSQASVYEDQELKKTFVFLPSIKRGIEAQMAKEDFARLHGIREALRLKIIQQMIRKFHPSGKRLI